MWACVCVCVCVCLRAPACERVVSACVRGWTGISSTFQANTILNILCLCACVCLLLSVRECAANTKTGQHTPPHHL